MGGFTVKVVLLAGGFGTRISEESQFKPKPMLEIGGKPILWHIMKEYAHYGYTDFIICAGYKQHIIKEYFSNYYIYNSDITFDFRGDNRIEIHNNFSEPWRVTIIDTGLNTMTGGRLKRIQSYINDEAFMMTYGDGVCDVPIDELVKFHKAQKKICTLTAVKPDGRFGILDLDGDRIKSFREKNKDDVGYINGGYMVLEPQIFNYIDGDDTILECEPFESLAADSKFAAFRHNGFWHCMDTLRDKKKLEKLWNQGKAPWKVW